MVGLTKQWTLSTRLSSVKLISGLATTDLKKWKLTRGLPTSIGTSFIKNKLSPRLYQNPKLIISMMYIPIKIGKMLILNRCSIKLSNWDVPPSKPFLRVTTTTSTPRYLRRKMNLIWGHLPQQRQLQTKWRKAILHLHLQLITTFWAIATIQTVNVPTTTKATSRVSVRL